MRTLKDPEGSVLNDRALCKNYSGIKAGSHLASQALRYDDRKHCDSFKPYNKYQFFFKISKNSN